MNSVERSNLALVAFEIVLPSLHSVRVDYSAINGALADKDSAGVILHICLVLHFKLKILIGVLIEVARLANEHGRHLICHVLLPAIKCG